MSDVLLVIDVQRELVDALPAERASECLTVLTVLLDHARSTGVPVAYVRHDGNEQELTPGSGSWQIATEVAPRARETIVTKRLRDAFRETNLQDVLTGLSANHLIVCGMQTEFCIDGTVRQAERLGYRVTLVADGHATYDAEGAAEAQIRDQVHRSIGGRSPHSFRGRTFA